MGGLAQSVAKMQAVGVGETAISVFADLYRRVEAGETGLIPEADIEPVTELPMLSEVAEEDAREALAHTAIIKLNGGLGTSMGLRQAKTLLRARGEATFFDVICRQVLAARERFDIHLPLLFMTSFHTHDDTLTGLAAYPDLEIDGIPLVFRQNQTPKLRAADLTPVEWAADPALEWCPPGHGDIFTVLLESGTLDSLVNKGFRYASIANGDNLGAAPDGRLAAWFAATGAPFASEVARRTSNDRKGGHIARRIADGQLVLRELAMVVPGEEQLFTDHHRHCFFNTNNLWVDLRALQETLRARDGVLGLPLIRNTKTVDPTDRSSTPVLQLETGMGTALSVFDGAVAVLVERDRFLPVKTTNELTLLRSTLFDLASDHSIHRTDSTELPTIMLNSQWFGSIADFEVRMPYPLDLRDATSLVVEGDYTFGRDISVEGDVILPKTDHPQIIADGTRLTAAHIQAAGWLQ